MRKLVPQELLGCSGWQSPRLYTKVQLHVYSNPIDLLCSNNCHTPLLRPSGSRGNVRHSWHSCLLHNLCFNQKQILSVNVWSAENAFYVDFFSQPIAFPHASILSGIVRLFLTNFISCISWMNPGKFVKDFVQPWALRTSTTVSSRKEKVSAVRLN